MPTPTTFAERIEAARHRFFVNREEESQAFLAALRSGPSTAHILYFHGPGGVGKTSLLHAFTRICDEERVPSYYLDAREIEPSAASFMEVLDRTVGRPEEGDTLAVLAEKKGRVAILIDTFELLADLGRWFREDFLPKMPTNAVLVFSGRRPPPADWRVDLGLREVLQTIPLRNLSTEVSRLYLSRRGVPEGQHDAVVGFAHGHPLALSLVADAFDQHPDMAFSPTEVPDLISTLMHRFLVEAATPDQRRAVEICALLRYTTESLLAEMMDEPDVSALFRWLRSLSFIGMGRLGLFPHDLAREVLMADLRWRDRERYRQLHEKARQCYTRRLYESPDHDSERILTDYVFLHRDNPVVRPFFVQIQSHAGGGVLHRDAFRAPDRPLLLEMAARHEGEASAALLDYWLDRQSRRVIVFRGAEGKAAGFLFPLSLAETTEADRQRDPAVQAAWGHLAAHAPLRSSEEALLFRFWMDEEAYQGVSAIQGLIFIHTVRHYLITPRLAYSFFPCGQPDLWQPILSYADLHHLSGADFTVEGKTYSVFGHDWRTVPPLEWLDRLAWREQAAGLSSPPPISATPSLLVLSRSDFETAVKQALQVFACPAKLRGNPLLQSRLVEDHTGREAGAAARTEVLCRILEKAATALRTHPREAKYFRAVHATYLQPAPTQERAAEGLDLPFSTYRRHLKRGIAALTDMLWQQEIGA